MSDEIEAKFKVAGHSAVRRALRRVGARYLATVIQTDRYFDTPQRMLMKRGCALRIRGVRSLRSGARAVDTRPRLTAKSPGPPSTCAKVRREIQARLDDAGGVVDVLEAMGLQPCFTVQKRRASYRLAPCLVELDELPLIGCFVEIEAPRAGEIARMCRRLGIEGPPIVESYMSLLTAACGRSASPCQGATFDEGWIRRDV